MYEQMDVSEVAVDGADPWELAAKVQKGVLDEEEHNMQEYMNSEEYAWDAVNNIQIPIELVRKARTEEMPHMRGKIFKVVDVAEAWQRTGKAPISTKWVDTDKTMGRASQW